MKRHRIARMDLFGKIKHTMSLKNFPSGATLPAVDAGARNMQPAHAEVASSRGSLNVGRFFFRVRGDTGQVFDLYYDRAMKNVDERKGQWFVYRELAV